MRLTAWFQAAPKLFAPASTSPSRKDRTRSAPAVQRRSARSFDVLPLFAQLFDLGANFQGEPGDGQRLSFDARSLRKHGVCFAMHLLQQKIQFLAEFASTVEQLCELLQVAAQAIEFFADVAALRKQRSFLRQT